MTDVNSNDLFDENKEKVTEEVAGAAESVETAAEVATEAVGQAAETVDEAEETEEHTAEETAEAEATPTDVDADKMAEIERLAALKFADQKDKKFEYKKEVNIDNRWLNIAGLVALLFLVAAVIIYLMPSKRVARLITKADELYAEADYENAGKAFEKALMIDALNPAAAKGFVSAAMAEDKQAAADDFRKVLNGVETIKARNGELKIKEEDVPGWVDVFLLSPEIFNAREDAEILAEGYELLGKPAEMKPALANAYFEWGEVVMNTNYNEAVDSFDKALSFSDYAETYQTKIGGHVDEMVETLKSGDKFEKAYEVLKHYENLFGDDYESKRQSIAAAEELYETKIALLSDVYDAMSPYYEKVKGTDVKKLVKEDTPIFGLIAENWEKMLMLDGSENANALAFSFTEDSFNYAKEGFSNSFTGVGCGLYTYGDKFQLEDGSYGIAYYFYFGEYKDGKRNGYGITFVKADVSSYLAFEGEWKDDEPNGFGISYECDMYSYTSLAAYRRTTYGEFKDGFENGDMTSIAVLNEHPDTYFKGSYKAENGAVAPVEGDLINYGIVDPVPEGYKLIAVLASATAGYDYIIPIYIPVDSLMAAVGR